MVETSTIAFDRCKTWSQRIRCKWISLRSAGKTTNCRTGRFDSNTAQSGKYGIRTSEHSLECGNKENFGGGLLRKSNLAYHLFKMQTVGRLKIWLRSFYLLCLHACNMLLCSKIIPKIKKLKKKTEIESVEVLTYWWTGLLPVWYPLWYHMNRIRKWVGEGRGDWAQGRCDTQLRRCNKSSHRLCQNQIAAGGYFRDCEPTQFYYLLTRHQHHLPEEERFSAGRGLRAIYVSTSINSYNA